MIAPFIKRKIKLKQAFSPYLPSPVPKPVAQMKLFNGSFGVADDDVFRAVKFARTDYFISQLPDGY